MLALYRCGRQADALAVYRDDARRCLRDELGLEPSRALHELERAILRHDAELEPESPSLRRRLRRAAVVSSARSRGSHRSVPAMRRTSSVASGSSTSSWSRGSSHSPFVGLVGSSGQRQVVAASGRRPARRSPPARCPAARTGATSLMRPGDHDRLQPAVCLGEADWCSRSTSSRRCSRPCRDEAERAAFLARARGRRARSRSQI